jgi:YD repeat-containing protein
MNSNAARKTFLALAIALGVALWIVPAHAAETYQYDPEGRLTDVAYANGGLLHYTYDGNGNILSLVTSLATAVEGGGAALQFTLGPATPNPGSGPRDLVFSIPTAGHVTLRVFDVTGRQVATLMDHDMPAGRYGARFFTDRWAAGVYYYRLSMGGHTRSGRMVVLR